MNNKTRRLLRFGWILSRFLLISLIILILLLGIAWQFLRSDHAYVIDKVQEIAQEKWEKNLKLSGYELEFISPFPLIQFQVNDLSITSATHQNYPLLKINHASSEFNLWDVVTEDFNARPFFIDSIWIHLYTDTLDQSNVKSKKETSSEKVTKVKTELDELPTLTINYLDFHREDDFKNEFQWAKLSQVDIQPQRNKNQEWDLHLHSDTYFEGLVFNEKEGGFLMDTEGELDLHFSLQDRGRLVSLDTSYLFVDEHVFLLGGQFHFLDTNRLELQISNTGIRIPEVLPLLSAEINQTLKDIKIDQPIAAHFSMDKMLGSKRNGVLQLDFSTTAASIDFQEVNMTSANLVGQFSNDCDHDGIGSSVNSCINIHQLDGDLFNIIPADLEGGIYNFRDPEVKAKGVIDIVLPLLNDRLAPKDKITFREGHASVVFEYGGNLKNILEAPFDEQNIRTKGDIVFEEVSLAIESQKAPLPTLSGHMYFNDEATILDDLSLNWQGANITIDGRLNNLPEFVFVDDQSLQMDLNIHLDQLDLTPFAEQAPANQPVKKDKTIDYLSIEKSIRKVANNINGEVRLEIDRMIYDTMFITDLATQFTLYSPHRKEFKDSVMVQINDLRANFMGKTPMYVDLGLSRDSIMELSLNIDFPKARALTNIVFPKGNEIKNGDLSVELMANGSLRSLFKPETLLSDFQYNGNINFDQIEAKLAGVDWPIKKMTGLVAFDNDEIEVEDFTFKYERSPFNLNGKISQYAYFGKDKKRRALVDLRLQGSHLDLRNSGKKSTTKTISPAAIFQDLDTVFHYANLKMDLRLDSILTDEHVIRPVILDVQLVPDELNRQAHQVKLDSFNFGFSPKNNIRGSARITNPKAPKIDADFQARMKFSQLGKLLPSEYVALEKGYFKMDAHYQSSLHEVVNAENYFLNTQINGDVEIVNGKIFYNYRDFTFDNIYGHFRFDERALFIEDLRLEINDNLAMASGESTDFFPFFILPNRPVHISLKVDAPRFDFDLFNAPHQLGKDTLVNTVDTTQSNFLEKVGFIDQLLGKGSLELDANIEELAYRKFLGKKLHGKISMHPDTVELSELSMDISDGQFKMDALISDIVYHQPKMQFTAHVDGSNVSEIFRQFDNFDQDFLAHNNIKGSAIADLKFNAEFNSNYEVLTETMDGDIRFQFIGGQLMDIPALKNAKGFLFRKRRLEHILMDTLEINTAIRGTELFVQDFNMHSSAFDFNVEGIYSLSSEDKTRFLISLPISNLYRRHLSLAQVKSGKSKRKGMKVFLEAKKKKDKFRFRLKWPLFGRKKYQMSEE